MRTPETRKDRWLLGWYTNVPEEIRARAARAVAGVVEAAERETGPLKDCVLVLLIPVDVPSGLAAHKSERIVPQPIRELADGRGMEYLIVLAAGLFRLKPRHAEAVVAHEFAHVVLGHCDDRLARFVTQFGVPGRMLYFHYEVAADRFAARLGYGQALVEGLKEFRTRTTFGKIRVAFRVWKLNQLEKERTIMRSVKLPRGFWFRRPVTQVMPNRRAATSKRACRKSKSTRERRVEDA